MEFYKGIWDKKKLPSHEKTKKAIDKVHTVKNMYGLQQTTEEEKETNLDNRNDQIQENLGEAESHETVREERWHSGVHCPFCSSKKTKRLNQEDQTSLYSYRYLCLDCDRLFSDTSKSPFESGMISLETWMHCWYLLGCTTSIEYIAAKLGLDPSIIEEMAEQLRRTFNVDQPRTEDLNFDKWTKHTEHLRKRVKASIAQKQKELHGSAVVNQAKDTSEERKQRSTHKVTTPRSGL